MIRRDESGYSMVEVLVAIIILVIAIVPMFAMFDVGLRTASTNSRYDKARSLAEKQMEFASSSPFTFVESSYGGTATPGNSTGRTDGAYPGFTYSVQKEYLGFPTGLSVNTETVELCRLSGPGCQAPDDGAAMIEVIVHVYHGSSSGAPVFSTRSLVTER